MENKFMKFVNENKWFIVFYLIWTFLHLIFYFSSNHYSGEFWPFVEDVDIDEYDFIELFVYLTLPLLIFVVVKLVGKDIQKAIDAQ
jgi:hypothetical protein